MNKQIIPIFVLTVALAISLTVNVVQFATRPSPSVSDGSSEASTTQTTAVTTDTKPNITVSTPADSTEITTPYGVMQYPAEFTEVYHRGSEEDGVYSHSFFYDTNGETIELFSVHFGDAQRGVLIGSVEVDGESVPFSVTSTSETIEGTEEETERFDRLLMSINDVIASVQAWENYGG